MNTPQEQFWTLIEQGLPPGEAWATIAKAITADPSEAARDHSVQPRAGIQWGNVTPDAISGLFARTNKPTDVLPYGVSGRDLQLRRLFTLQGNDLIQSAVSATTQKVQSTGHVIEGPSRTAKRASDLVRFCDLGRGWDEYCAKWSQDYLTQDNGPMTEVIWDDAQKDDYELTDVAPGASIIGFAHLDSARCARTGDAEFPILYTGVSGGTHKLHWKRVTFCADMPSPDERLLGRGFCALSRALSVARTTIQYATYRNEMLDDLPPLALLILQNINKDFWKKGQEEFNAGRLATGQEFFSNFMPLFSMDPKNPVDAKLIPFKELWSNFNEKDFYDVAIDLVAMAFGIDRQELAPLATSGLGGGKEGTVLSQKARGKGVGRMLSALERQINLLLPASCTFKFDYQDDEQDLQQANLRNIKSQNIINLSAARAADPFTGLGAVEPLITRDEARQLIVREIPEWSDIIRAAPDGTSTFTDVDEQALAPADNLQLAAKALRRYGPRTRIYRTPKASPVIAPYALRQAADALRGYHA